MIKAPDSFSWTSSWARISRTGLGSLGLVDSWAQKTEAHSFIHCLFIEGLFYAHVLFPLSMGFSKQEYWRGLPFPSPGVLPNPGMEPGLMHRQADSLPLSHLGSPSGTVDLAQILKSPHFNKLVPGQGRKGNQRNRKAGELGRVSNSSPERRGKPNSTEKHEDWSSEVYLSRSERGKQASYRQADMWNLEKWYDDLIFKPETEILT